VNFPKILLIGSVTLFAVIGVKAMSKKGKSDENTVVKTESPLPVHQHVQTVSKPAKTPTKLKIAAVDNTEWVDRVNELFTLGSGKLPIVETISYSSRVPWLKGRPAWVADYASHFKTSRHFIARSLNKKTDYFTQKVSPGSRFNVFKSDVNFNFYLLVDLSRCKMWFYYHDLDQDQKILLKTYKVGLGNLEDSLPSGSTTPEGQFLLGEKIATYRPNVMSFFQNERVEMIQVFGTRWLPFLSSQDGEEFPEGYGIHGAPCATDPESNELVEMRDCIGKYESSGCIRLYREDVEELYSIVVTRPTLVEIVKDATPILEKIDAHS